jgi:NADPH:quinone reductase-like Zn-dependent oxidoreductase
MENTRLIFKKFGKPDEVIEQEKTPRQNLANDESLVEMILAPINPSDLIPISGAYAHRIGLPSLLGYEGVGKVVESSNKKLIGQLVLPLKGEGTWQKFVRVKTDHLIVVPENISIGQAAQSFINPVTAFLLITRELRLNKGDFLLINAANSSIGRIFIQLSKVYEFKIIAVVRNESYKKGLLALGADFVVHTDDLSVEVNLITHGYGVKGAIDSIGGVDGTKLARKVKHGGKFITIGLLSGKQVDWQEIMTQGIDAKMYHLRHWSEKVETKEWQEVFTEIFSLIGEGHLELLPVESVYPFEEYQKAIKAAMNASVKKKVFLSF